MATTTVLKQPSGYTPSALINTVKPNTSSSMYTTLDNIELIGIHLNQEFIYQAVMLDFISSQVASNAVAITSLDAKITVLDAKVANMQPQVITESISFLLGAFIAIAFVISSKLRY